MGKIDELRLKETCKKEGRIEEFEVYKNSKVSIENNIKNFYGKSLDNAIAKFDEVKKKYSEDSLEYREAKDEVNRWKYNIEESRLKLKFIRPNSKEDIEYREEQCESFVSKLQEVLPRDLDLRFHGTPIYFAEQMIKSGKISSTADRNDGYMKSTDLKGEISASNIDTLKRTIDFFSDLSAYQRSMPAGCIFALLPKDKEDAELGKISIMHSVNFKKNPEQLYGIFTTPENIQRVKSWLNESEIDSNLVYTFEEFIETFREKDIVNEDKVKQSFLFDENDAKEVAMESGQNGRKIGQIVNLQSKIKNAIMQIKTNIKETDEKKIGGNIDDREIGD